MTGATATKVPISEDCDSKFRIGFLALREQLFNPEQAKDFRHRKLRVGESQDR